MRKGTQELLKTLNRSILVQLLQRHGRLSRTDMVEMTQLSPSTVTVLSEQLIADGLIRECGTAQSSGGRKPRLLELNPNAGYLVGVDLGGNSPRAGLINLQGKVEHLVEGEPHHDERHFTPADVIALIKRLLRKAPEGRLFGMGISVPGMLNAETGTVIYSSLLQWEQVELGEALRAEFNARICLVNDGNAAAMAERAHGRGQGVDYLLYVAAGRGIGSGLILGGDIYTGPRGMSCELGHMTVDLNGPLCRCGNRGCVGTVASGRFLAAQAREAIAQGTASQMADLVQGDLEAIGAHEVVEAAAQGDPLARELLVRSGTYIAAGIASLINTVNPELVVVGGSMIHEESLLLQTIQAEVRARVLPVNREVPVVQTSLGEDGKLIGAAAVVLEQVLRPVQIKS